MSSSRSACHSKAKSFSFGVGIGDSPGAVKSPKIWIVRWIAGNSGRASNRRRFEFSVEWPEIRRGVQSTDIWKVRWITGSSGASNRRRFERSVSSGAENCLADSNLRRSGRFGQLPFPSPIGSAPISLFDSDGPVSLAWEIPLMENSPVENRLRPC